MFCNGFLQHAGRRRRGCYPRNHGAQSTLLRAHAASTAAAASAASAAAAATRSRLLPAIRSTAVFVFGVAKPAGHPQLRLPGSVRVGLSWHQSAEISRIPPRLRRWRSTQRHRSAVRQRTHCYPRRHPRLPALSRTNLPGKPCGKLGTDARIRIRGCSVRIRGVARWFIWRRGRVAADDARRG